jgi:hypothetical protein
MELASIADHYLDRFKGGHGATTTPDQWSALNAILGCRTAQYGELMLSCPACAWHSTHPRSCGHRSCNRCQNHCATQWLARQERKLLPVQYFMVTFTLPYELRALGKAHQRVMYALLFECAVATVKDFGMNDKGLAAELAMTAVLHTHTRRLDYHPHIHMIVPGGGVNTRRKEWRKLKGKYLFNECALAAVFRGKLLSALQQAGLVLPRTPKKWVAHCEHVGRGLPALQYLSRYLYRGVISNQQIVSDDGDFVTFQYKESKTGNSKTRRLRGEDFIALVLQHTLPKGFRRARDYGFLHGNAKRLLQTVQWILQVAMPRHQAHRRPPFLCRQCQAPMSMIGFTGPHAKPG